MKILKIWKEYFASYFAHNEFSLFHCNPCIWLAVKRFMRKMSPEASRVKRDWEVLDWFASGGALSQGLRSVYFNYKCVQQKKRDTHTQLCTDVCNTYAQRIMSITKAEITHRNILYKFFHLKHIYPVHLMAKCVPWAGRQRERREREREKKLFE